MGLKLETSGCSENLNLGHLALPWRGLKFGSSFVFLLEHGYSPAIVSPLLFAKFAGRPGWQCLFKHVYLAFSGGIIRARSEFDSFGWYRLTGHVDLGWKYLVSRE